MRNSRSRRIASIAIAGAFVASASPAAADNFTTLYEFGAVAKDAAQPWSTVIYDGKGNLYGTTSVGGQYGDGAVFELSPPKVKGGPRTEAVLFSFGGYTNDGVNPRSRLVRGPSGKLYGLTAFGGAYGAGAAFELAPPATAGGPWTETILHSFGAYLTDGQYPVDDGLTRDANGHLYGATIAGGAVTIGGLYNLCPNGCGAVFELSPPASSGGQWSERLIHSFGRKIPLGYGPQSGFIADSCGNLYGVAGGGGVYGTLANGGGGGAVYELKAPGEGENWTETLIASFDYRGGGGWRPFGPLAFDSSGNLYGTTLYGGSGTDGTVFQSIRPSTSGGQWTTTTIHNFFGPPYDGEEPLGGLVVDAKGDVFGASQGGGANSYGSVFELTPPKTTGGTWTFSFVHSFGSFDGSYPTGGLTKNAAGDLLGTTLDSGPYCDCGTVYEVTP